MVGREWEVWYIATVRETGGICAEEECNNTCELAYREGGISGAG